jgi:alkyldihydroxyacetonephosphate synthase
MRAVGHPEQPIEVDADHVVVRLATTPVALPSGLLERLRSVCAVVDDLETRVASSRDWWFLGMTWAVEGKVAQITSAVAWPKDATEVAAILRLCNDAGVPVTPASGRSGGEGGLVPVFGGVTLDMTGIAGIVDLDGESLTVEVLPGTFGLDFEHELRSRGYTLGHWPQSIEMSTVGGWLSCRGAGQYAAKYGKIEDMVIGLSVVLADGTSIRTGGGPRASAGPDLNQLFVGAEGTLGVITSARLRLHPAPAHQRAAAFGVPDFVDAIDICRGILRTGARPAVLRCHEPSEAQRLFGHEGDTSLLIALDEGDQRLVDVTMDIVEAECAGRAEPLGEGPATNWLEQRNDVSWVGPFLSKGFVMDTVEMAGPWSVLPAMYRDVIVALHQVPHMRAASCRISHAYLDGACLYFSFTTRPPEDEREATFIAAWDAATRAGLAAGGNLAHHHGVGINRSRYMREALGPAHGVLQKIKDALDPKDVCNPGKLGFAAPYGTTSWP